mgnify:CR=1 FL=1
MKILPKTFRWQIVTLLLGSLLVSQLISSYIIIGERSLISINERIDKGINSYFTTAELLINTPEYLHEDLLKSVNNENYLYSLNDNKKLSYEIIYDKKNTGIANDRLFNFFKNTDFSIGTPTIIVTPGSSYELLDIHSDYTQYISKYKDQLIQKELFELKPNYDRLDIEALLPNGQWLNAIIITKKFSLGLQFRLIGIILITLITVSLIAIFISIKLTRPIQDLAKASDKLGKGQNVEKLNETGSEDIKEALIAFNIMNKRIRDLLTNQKEMLGAISHDLRSPLTSLRLRLENIEDNNSKKKMIHTVEEMNEMITSILNFVKQEADEKNKEKSQRTNAYSFSQSLIEEYTDTGRNCQLNFKIKKDVTFNCRYSSLRRALRNIIDNGLNYGEKIIFSVEDKMDEKIFFSVIDDGPGVPEEYLHEIKKPFFRADISRNTDKGNIGMGLAISESIVKAHGGRMNLANHSAGGLEVIIELPI